MKKKINFGLLVCIFSYRIVNEHLTFSDQIIRGIRTDSMYLQCTVVYFLLCGVAFSSAEILIRGTETARVGSQARLQCIARDYDNQPRKISWFHNERLVLKSSRNTITELFNENKNGYTLSELQIPEVRKGDAGRYVCKTDKRHQASLYLDVN